MRNHKWNQFTSNDEEIPQTWYEACVFLSHAHKHLRNRTDGPLGKSHDILMRASEMVRDSEKQRAA